MYIYIYIYTFSLYIHIITYIYIYIYCRVRCKVELSKAEQDNLCLNKFGASYFGLSIHSFPPHSSWFLFAILLIVYLFGGWNAGRGWMLIGTTAG